MNDLFKKRNEFARKLASMTPDDVLKIRTGYAGKSQQWQYGFDLACREKQAEIDALKAQNAALERRLIGRNGWVGTQKPNCSEEKCLYDQQGGDLEDELALS